MTKKEIKLEKENLLNEVNEPLEDKKEVVYNDQDLTLGLRGKVGQTIIH